MSVLYLEACSKKGLRPLKEVQSAIEGQRKDIKVSSKVQMVEFT